MFCLIPEKVEEFKKALKEKDINISDLLNMSSEDRTALLEKYAGQNAKDVNLLFEQKLVLKNKLLGIKNWASKVGEIGKYSSEGKAQFEKAVEDYKNAQFGRIFNPKEDQAYLANLAEHKFGTAITKDEATNLFNLTQKAEEFKKKLNLDDLDEGGNFKNQDDAIKYASSKVTLEKYVEELKTPNISIKEGLKDRYSVFKQTFSENKSQAVGDVLMDSLKTINDNTIALVATVDDSFIGRQGLNTLQTHPSTWYPAAKNSITNFLKTLKGEDAMDAVLAKTYSRPNYLNGSFEKAKLIPKSEEQYPSSLFERLWGVGRVFKASEVAFKSSSIEMRTGLYDLLSATAKSNGVDVMDDVFIKDLGKLVNSITARGEGKISNNEVTRLFLWAPKMLKSNLDVLTAHFGGAGLKTSFARKQAWINLSKITAETVGLAVLLNAISPNSVETNPISSDFLKEKQNKTRFDLTAGKASIITLIARIIIGYSKSTTTGKITKINSGDYGAKTLFDVGMDFLVNKTTPPARTIIDYLKGTDANFEPTTFKGELLNKLPISIQNFYQLKDDPSAPAVIGAFVDLFGVNSNTYKPTPKKSNRLKPSNPFGKK